MKSAFLALRQRLNSSTRSSSPVTRGFGKRWAQLDSGPNHFDSAARVSASTSVPRERCLPEMRIRRAVAVSIAARDEQHRSRCDARDEERIVVGAAHHGKKFSRAFGRIRKGLRSRWRAVAGASAFSNWFESQPAAPLISTGWRFLSFASRRRGARSVSRISTLRRTWLGMLLTAPGNTSQMPTVATVSMARGAARPSRSPESIRRRRTRHRGGRASRTPPACPPEPSMETRRLAGAAIFVTMPSGICWRSSSGPCSMCKFAQRPCSSRSAALPLRVLH
jgi:hypothetical protein